MKQEAHQLAEQAKCCVTKIWPKAVGGEIFGHGFELWEMLTGSNWWPHMLCGCRLEDQHGCPCKIWWFLTVLEIFKTLSLGRTMNDEWMTVNGPCTNRRFALLPVAHILPFDEVVVTRAVSVGRKRLWGLVNNSKSERDRTSMGS